MISKLKQPRISNCSVLCTCEICGKQFFVQCFQKARGRGRYCSITCRAYGQRHYHFNENYFSLIDNENKAYWLGFIVADGHVNVKPAVKTRDYYRLLIALSNKDEHHLITFLRHIGDDASHLQHYAHGVVRVELCSRQLGYDIAKIRGTSKNQVPIGYILSKIPTPLHSHFFRGIFDGDGSVCITVARPKYGSKYGKPYTRFQLALAGQLDTCRAFSEFMGFEGRNVYPSHSKAYFNFMKYGSTFVKVCYESLYHDATVYLERKREIWLRFIDSHTGIQKEKHQGSEATAGA